MLRIRTRAIRFQSLRSWPLGYEAPSPVRVGGHLWDPGNKDNEGDRESEWCGFRPGKSLHKGWLTSFCEGPESKHLRLHGLNGLHLNYSVCHCSQRTGMDSVNGGE